MTYANLPNYHLLYTLIAFTIEHLITRNIFNTSYFKHFIVAMMMVKNEKLWSIISTFGML